MATSIPVDEVRRLKAFLGLTGGQDSWRVVIVDSADELNPNAANALLKSLEEPPQRALFVLISAAPNGILPTIRSRCRRLELAPLAGNDLERAVGAAFAAVGGNAPAADTFAELERLAKGSVRAALQLAGSGGLELYRQIEALFGALPNVDWSAAHNFADQLVLAGHEQRFEAFFDLFLDHLSRLVRAAATANADAKMCALAERLIGEGRLPMWAGLWQSVLSERNEAARLNLDRKALVLAALARLEGLARG